MPSINEDLLLSLAQLEQVAECLRVMAHPVRLRIVELLMQGDFAVHELASLCQSTPNQTCEHLRLMKGHGFLTSRREGRTVYYQINTRQLPNLINCIRNTCDCSPILDKSPQSPSY